MSANGETPRRLTLRDAYQDAQHVIDQLTTRTATEPSASVEITRNAKGEVQFTTKVYAPASADPADVQRATEHAYDQAVEAFDHLGALYPVGQSQGAQEYAREARAAAKKAN